MIAGGSGTLAGPIVGAAIVVILKNYVSAYIERWNMLLGFVFVVIVIFMPDGIVPGIRRLWARWKTPMTPALEISGLKKSFGGLPAMNDVSLAVMPGERRLIIGPNGAGKTTLFNLITGDLARDRGTIRLFGEEVQRLKAASARAPRARAHLPDHHAVCARYARAQRRAVAARAGAGTLEHVRAARRARASLHGGARRARAGRPRASRASGR